MITEQARRASLPLRTETQFVRPTEGECPEANPSFAPLKGTNGFHLRVAEGWVGMGDYAAATEQLEKISSEQRTHPDVLKARWQICVNTKNWEAALDVASTLVLLDPTDSLGWAHLSFALHALHRTAEARNNLLLVAHIFSGNATMRYNLACYECQLGRLEEAKAWLLKAFNLGDKRRMMPMAFADSDLAPLWEWIKFGTGSCRKQSGAMTAGTKLSATNSESR